MPQLYPDAMRDVAMNQISNGNGGITTPPEQDFNTESMQGSMQQFLSENLGEFVVVEFLIGTQSMQQKEGILYAVGTSVLVLYEERSQTFVLCDIFSVKFVTFYMPGQRPGGVPATGLPGRAIGSTYGENAVPMSMAPKASGCRALGIR